MYKSLERVLDRAYEQAAHGKGAERHGGGLPFEEQPMQTISDLLGTHNGLLYQAMKKIQESNRLDRDAAVRELLGAINYIAGAVVYIEKQATPVEEKLAWPNIVEADGPTWVCTHGMPYGVKYHVPVGDACPICFATK